MARSAHPAPKSISVRMYNVGFGDCFLVTFHYPTSDAEVRPARHMLVDFGTTEHPGGGSRMAAVARDLQAHTGGTLDVVVATHRHADHISGFAGTATDKVMDALEPRLVIRPWTDDPDAPRAANAPHPLDPQSRAFLRTIDARTEWLKRLADEPGGNGARKIRLPADLKAQLPNANAIKRLDGWAKPDRAIYVKAGDELNLDRTLPGVTAEVLGPPTLAQVDNLASEAFDHDEFWLAAGQDPPTVLQDNRRLADAYRKLAEPGGRGEASWILSRLHDSEAATLFQVARAFDDALNNTSLILLVRAGSRSMLLTGDAQIENWSHALALAGSRAGRRLRDQLADVDLYKVGHHGSRNATPRSLYAMWEHRKRVPANMVSLMSTLPGKHGKHNPVPKQNLVEAIEKVSTLYRTDTLGADQVFVELAASTRGASGFAPVGP